MSTPEQAARNAAVKEAYELSRLVREFIDAHHHGIQATALLSAFIHTALANPCCTQACIAQLGKASSLLANAIDTNQAPAQGQPIH